jgi:hypothetical protein
LPGARSQELDQIQGRAPLPGDPATLAAYLANFTRTHGRAAVRCRLAAVGQTHRLMALP